VKRINYTPYFLLLALIFFCVSLPVSLTLSLRSFFIGNVAPLWQGMHEMTKLSSSFFLPGSERSVKGEQLHKIKELERENQRIKHQLEQVRHWLLSQDRTAELQERLSKLEQQGKNNIADPGYYRRRAKEIVQILGLEMQAIPAKVIYREPTSWSSFLWINVGQKHNKSLGKVIIAKNSPVLCQGALVGVVDEVRNSQSRVRLITDTRLHPSVRSVRGGRQNDHVLLALNNMQMLLSARSDLFQSAEEKESFSFAIDCLIKRLANSCDEKLLAKGILYGSGAPLWRLKTSTLQGVGFNYDRGDEEGPARDLITGRPKTALHLLQSLAIIVPGDLLVTTGYDGVFPPGLAVAVVKTVEPLKEGSSSYTLSAEALVGSFDDLSQVLVLPATGFEGSCEK
jgi:rod shape-determining protein MreC